MFHVSPEVADAVPSGRPVVALESTLIAHGLPFPANLDTALESEAAVRAAGAIPATVAVWHGVPTVGLTGEQLRELATATGVVKASRRDLGAAVALRQLAATTVSATMALAHKAGISVFATGGLGGAHRPPAPASDISADLTELGRTPVLVVCAGAKSILDLPRTLEILETLGVPILGFGTDTFPQFYTRSGTLPVSARVDSPEQAAAAFAAHIALGGAGMVLANPLPDADAIPQVDFDAWLAKAELDAASANVGGAKLTPFLLARLAVLSDGRTLAANKTLIVNNARLAARVAVCLGSP